MFYAAGYKILECSIVNYELVIKLLNLLNYWKIAIKMFNMFCISIGIIFV